MRILQIRNSHAVIEVESTELDRIVNDYLDLQYAVGYEDGASDWQKACGNADVDDDDSKEE